jgi:hypothetical protein
MGYTTRKDNTSLKCFCIGIGLVGDGIRFSWQRSSKFWSEIGKFCPIEIQSFVENPFLVAPWPSRNGSAVIVHSCKASP